MISLGSILDRSQKLANTDSLSGLPNMLAAEEKCQTMIDLGQAGGGMFSILLIDGEPVPYALARIPSADDNRGNLVMGARGVGQPLSDADRAICDRVGPALRDAGVIFAGIDVIGDFLIVGEHLGSVEHVGLRTTRLRSLSGEQLVFSNNDLLGARLPTRALSDYVLDQVNLTTVSPFYTRGPVPEHMFFGREREINEVRSKLRTHSVALIGPRCGASAARTTRRSLTGFLTFGSRRKDRPHWRVAGPMPSSDVAAGATAPAKSTMMATVV